MPLESLSSARAQSGSSLRKLGPGFLRNGHAADDNRGVYVQILAGHGLKNLGVAQFHCFEVMQDLDRKLFSRQ